jgi:transposase
MKSLVTKILANTINSLPRSSSAGRHRLLTVEYVLDRIGFVLRTGCQWSNLPVDGGSWKTVYHWFSLWSKKHVFQHAFQRLLSLYLREKGLSKHVVVDTSFVKNVLGRDCLGKSAVDRGRKATKVSALTDGFGTPLYLLFHPGNKYDGKTLHHLLQKASLHLNLGGVHLYGDKGYDSQRCDSVADRFRMVKCFTRKKSPPVEGANRKRIVVEHTFSWLDKYRRIIMRYDGLVCHFRSFHYLAAGAILSNRFFS